MKITITGATGFVGTNLQKYLKTSHELESISVRYASNQFFDIKTEAIVHLAGKAHDLKKVSLPSEYYEANYELTKQLFDFFLNSEIRAFVFVSTVKAAADEVVGVLKEEAIPIPKTHYGIAKLQAEKYILNQPLPEGKRVYILRPCMIYGPGNKGNLNLLYKLVSKGLPWPLGAFENQRSFLSVENLCFVIKELLENTSISSGVYQVADDKPLSTNEVIQFFGSSLGKKNRIWKINTSLIKSIAKIGDWIHLPLNTERLKKLTESYVVSNQKIVEALGKSLPVSVEGGLIEACMSFRE